MPSCDVCGKIGRMGRNVSHSKRHTPHRWMPNIHVAHLPVNGTVVRQTVCTRCIRTLYRTPRA
ncbi:MAG: 50S ribosomal protein L28 [Dehalococcoidia bacterium]|nr:50S ribosomal protein L28 [Dehalococcoidia bacterium]